MLQKTLDSLDRYDHDLFLNLCLKFAFILLFISVVDPFHFDTDLVPMITDPDPDPGRILTKIQSFEIS